jgi:hypothetical protein
MATPDEVLSLSRDGPSSGPQASAPMPACHVLAGQAAAALMLINHH